MSQPHPAVGDIWQECDPRFPRFVKVSQVDATHVRIYAVESQDDGWTVAKNPTTNRPAPERWAKLERFNGKRTGYALFLSARDLKP